MLATDCMSVSPPPPPNSYIEILTLNVMGLIGEAFRGLLGHEDGAP